VREKSEGRNFFRKSQLHFLSFSSCFYKHLLPVFKALVLTKVRTEIAILCDGLRGNGRKLVVQIGLIEVNEFDSVLNKVFCHTMELGFVLSCQKHKMWMIWQVSTIECYGGFPCGVRCLHCLLGSSKVFPYKDVDIIFVAVLRVWHRSSPKGVKMTVKRLLYEYSSNPCAKSQSCFVKM
jgi:hypothetical protein